MDYDKSDFEEFLPEEPINDKPAPPASPSPRRRSRGLTIAGSVGALGMAGLIYTQAVSASTATGTPAGSTSVVPDAAVTTAAPSGSTAPAASTAPQASTAPEASEAPDTDAGNGGPGMGGHTEAVTDTSVAATAIGIKEADLITAVQSGQSLAAVAKANSVDPQVVIDALVKDKKGELAAEVTAGTLTQAQADAEAANLTQFATEQVNGTFQGGHGSH